MIGHSDRVGIIGFIAPALVLVLLIAVLPFLYIVYMSFGGTSLTWLAYQQLLASGLFLRSLYTTIEISLWASLFSTLIGYAIAVHLARLSPRGRALCMMLVLLPFWTSVLVKCYAFTVILGRSGLINGLLGWMTQGQLQIPLLLNRTGVMIGMTNYLTPFVVFPILASLLSIDPALYRAASIMGAKPLRIFFTITLPLSIPGILAALVSVTVMGLSFFIIPSLLGGPRDSMLSNLVDFYTRETLDWNLASAVGVLLLGMIILVAVPLNLLRRARGRL